MRTIPSSVELLESVAHFLRDEVSKNISAPISFYAIVAANAVDIVRREIEQGEAANESAVRRLRTLLSRPDGSLAELEAQLAENIRTGQLTAESAGLKDHLWRTTLAEVAIDQPNYATYKYVRDRFAGATIPQSNADKR